MIKEKVLEEFSSWDRERQLKEYQGYKKLGSYSPFTETDYKLMETLINNPNIEATIECNAGICTIKEQDSSEIIKPEENRYVVTLEMYMWDKDDESVKKQASDLAKKLSKEFDNDCTVTDIVEQKFGTIGNRKVSESKNIFVIVDFDNNELETVAFHGHNLLVDEVLEDGVVLQMSDGSKEFIDIEELKAQDDAINKIIKK